MTPENCPICGVVGDASTACVYADDLWWAGVMPGLEVPGWLVLALRRHAEEATGMTDDESRSLGPLLVALTNVLKRTAGAERVYVLAFGEDILHWHMLLASRTGMMPLEHQRGRLFEEKELYRDRDRAAAVARQARGLLANASSSKEEGRSE